VLLIDVEHFQTSVEERVRQIRDRSPGTMIIALHDAGRFAVDHRRHARGIAEYFYPPLQKNLRDVLERQGRPAREKLSF